MDILIPENMAPEAKKQIVRDNADSIDRDISYQKPLTTEELDVKREKLTDNAIKLSEWEEELDAVKSEYKTKMKPLKAQNAMLLGEIKTKQETIRGNLYNMANHDTGFMESYNDEGDLIGTRKLRPDEKKKTLFSIPKASNQ